MLNLESKESGGRDSSFNESVDRFIFTWHDFPFDLWWRKRHSVAFGSSAHREMSFIDMYIEWREELILSKAFAEKDSDWLEENDTLEIGSNKEVVRMTQEEIEDDYDNLNLEDFDEK